MVATCSLVLAGDVVAWVSWVLVGWGVSHLAVVAALEGCFPADVVGGGDRLEEGDLCCGGGIVCSW